MVKGIKHGLGRRCMQSGQMRPSLPTVLTRICDGGNGRGDGDDDDKAHFKYHLS